MIKRILLLSMISVNVFGDNPVGVTPNSLGQKSCLEKGTDERENFGSIIGWCTKLEITPNAITDALKLYLPVALQGSVYMSLAQKRDDVGMFNGTPHDCYDAVIKCGILRGSDYETLQTLAANVGNYVNAAQKANKVFVATWNSKRSPQKKASRCRNWVPDSIPKYYKPNTDFKHCSAAGFSRHFTCEDDCDNSLIDSSVKTGSSIGRTKLKDLS